MYTVQRDKRDGLTDTNTEIQTVIRHNYVVLITFLSKDENKQKLDKDTKCLSSFRKGLSCMYIANKNIRL